MHELIKDLIERIKAGSKISRNPEEDIATLESWLQLEDNEISIECIENTEKPICNWLYRREMYLRQEKKIKKLELDLLLEAYCWRAATGVPGLGLGGPKTLENLARIPVMHLTNKDFVKECLKLATDQLRSVEGSEELCREIDEYNGEVTPNLVVKWQREVGLLMRPHAEKKLADLENQEDPESVEERDSLAFWLEFLK